MIETPCTWSPTRQQRIWSKVPRDRTFLCVWSSLAHSDSQSPVPAPAPSFLEHPPLLTFLFASPWRTLLRAEPAAFAFPPLFRPVPATMETQSANKLHEDESTMQVMEEDVPELGRYEAFKQRCRRAAHTIRGVERRVNHSTFGRMFRLKGCGHVSVVQLRFHSSYNQQASLLLFLHVPRLTRYFIIGTRNSGCQLSQRNTCWADNICHHGVHHCGECKSFRQIKSHSLLCADQTSVEDPCRLWWNLCLRY